MKNNISLQNSVFRVKSCLLISAFVNIVLTVVQIVAGILSGSQGLLSDGIHTLSDLMVDCVVLLVNQHSNKEPDEDHHYGHKRYDTVALLFLGFSLLLVGVGILWTSVDNLLNFNNKPIQIMALYVALTSLVVKELLYRYIFSVSQKIQSTLLQATAWHVRSDAASSLVVSVGIIGVFIGLPILDALSALVVSLMIIYAGWRFGWNALNDLMDRSVSLEDIQQIQQIISHIKGVKGYHNLRTRKMGDAILVDVHLDIDGESTVREGHEIALQVKNKIMAEMPVLNVMTHVDPV